MKKSSLSKLLIILLLITVIFNITGCAKKPTEENAANVSNDETLIIRWKVVIGDFHHLLHIIPVARYV